MRTTVSKPRVCIIGVGLIGGSLGLALRRFEAALEVVGVDADSGVVATALSRGVMDRAASLGEAVAGADVVVLAAPVGAIVRLLPEVANYARPGTLITDTGSTKALVTSAAACAGFVPGVSFVGGHPMAGSEAHGVEAADPYLFENAFWLITPVDEPPTEVVARLIALVRSIGAIPQVMGATVHDRLVAAISHLPHVVAASLVNAATGLSDTEQSYLPFAAGGFRDTTRVAGSDAHLWVDILMTNRTQLLPAIDRFQGELIRFRDALDSGARDGLERLLEAAQSAREVIPAHRRGVLGNLPELVVQLEDHPGAIAGVASALGEAGVNIRDIEILRFREGEGGSVRVAVGSESEAAEALKVLKSDNITAYQR